MEGWKVLFSQEADGENFNAWCGVAVLERPLAILRWYEPGDDSDLEKSSFELCFVSDGKEIRRDILRDNWPLELDPDSLRVLFPVLSCCLIFKLEQSVGDAKRARAAQIIRDLGEYVHQSADELGSPRALDSFIRQVEVYLEPLRHIAERPRIPEREADDESCR